MTDLLRLCAERSLTTLALTTICTGSPFVAKLAVNGAFLSVTLRPEVVNVVTFTFCHAPGFTVARTFALEHLTLSVAFPVPATDFARVSRCCRRRRGSYPGCRP